MRRGSNLPSDLRPATNIIAIMTKPAGESTMPARSAV
jgi:hypothetical protein